MFSASRHLEPMCQYLGLSRWKQELEALVVMRSYCRMRTASVTFPSLHLYDKICPLSRQACGLMMHFLPDLALVCCPIWR
jgi:hypothetical protein